ncbi:hypothetical protein F5888DRAFT_1665576, partial [Russula emetica]
MISKSFIALSILALTVSVNAAAISPRLLARDVASLALPPISERAAAPIAVVEKRLRKFLFLSLAVQYDEEDLANL